MDDSAATLPLAMARRALLLSVLGVAGPSTVCWQLTTMLGTWGGACMIVSVRHGFPLPLTPYIPHLGIRVMGICVGDHTNIRSFVRLMVIWPLTLHTLRPVDRSNLDLILDRSNLDLILRTTMSVRIVIVPQQKAVKMASIWAC